VHLRSVPLARPKLSQMTQPDADQTIGPIQDPQVTSNDPTLADTPGTIGSIESLTPPFRLARYVATDVLGAGAMGRVFSARQDETQRIVALKVIRPELVAGIASHLVHEGIALARLNHPGIAQIYEAGREPCPFIAMEFVAGQKLGMHVVLERPSLSQRVGLMLKLIEAVAYAHRAGVIHLDLKPDNILVVGGEPKVVDFGIARILTTESGTQSTEISGTPRYMSPEQTFPGHRVDYRADVYTLGLIAYELFSLRRAYEFAPGSSSYDVLEVVRKAEPATYSSSASEPENTIQTTVLKALHKRPEERYASAEAFAEDLRRGLNGAPTTTTPPSRLRRFRLWSGQEQRIAQARPVALWGYGLLTVVLFVYLLVGFGMVNGWIAHPPELRPREFFLNILFWTVTLLSMTLLSRRLRTGEIFSTALALAGTSAIFLVQSAALFGVTNYDVGGGLAGTEARELFFALTTIMSGLGTVLLGFALNAELRSQRLSRPLPEGFLHPFRT
jgi:serine/threonine protein kinase